MSNIVVFGDSLSDIGNMPESQHLYAANNPTDGVAPNLYVPLSNPVNQSVSKEYTMMDKDNHSYSIPYPIPSSKLPDRMPLDGLLRQWRSIEWPSYFVNEAHINGVINSDTIIPWISLYGQYQFSSKDLPSINISVDYAWYAALTIDGCANDNFIPFASSDCTASGLYDAQNKYRHGVQTESGSTVHDVRIPGLLMQLRLFLADKEQQHIVTDEYTGYFIFIGGNDLTVAFNQLQSLKIFNFIQRVRTTTPARVEQAVQKLLENGVTAKQIYLLNLFDLSLTPKAINMGRFTTFMAHHITNSYNARLADIAKKMGIHLYNVHGIVEQAAHTTMLHDSLGKQCVQYRYDGHYPYQTTAGSTLNCDGYLFWNAAHPSTIVEQLLAHKLVEYMTRL